MSMLTRRLAEKTSQCALATAILATSTVASNPASYQAGNSALWLTLIPVWAGSLITVCLPEAGSPAIQPNPTDQPGELT